MVTVYRIRLLHGWPTQLSEVSFPTVLLIRAPNPTLLLTTTDAKLLLLLLLLLHHAVLFSQL
jgi:hypothetical protein